MNEREMDAHLHLTIRRMMSAPGTTSDHLLILADHLDEASKALGGTDMAKIFYMRAEDARRLAPFFADAHTSLVG